jgi:hypothetical protein
MSLETAAVAAGKAVGKHLVMAWLAGRKAEQEQRADLVELVQARFPDRIARRRFDRQIADIADQVAERLLTLCGHEYRGLRRNDKAAAAADLSDKALFSADVDPIRLAAQARASLPRRNVEAELGEASAQLYSVVLDECCDCLVRIVRQLPEFGPRTSAETLARLSGLADQVSQVLARLPVRTLDAPTGSATDESFSRRYLEHIIVTQDVLELFGVRVEHYRPRTTLSVAYISLSVSADRQDVGPGGRGSRVGRTFTIDEWAHAAEESGDAILRVEAALGQAPLTLIRGEAGSGKTTLLRWLAISAARGAFTADLAEWNGCIPFLVKLRSHNAQPLPPPERFLDGVADPIAGLMPEGWVHRQLRNGKALLLVDGVDELPGAQRRAVRPWLAGMIAAYPGMRAVVTSRPAAASSDWLASEGFTTAFLERMTPADVKELIRHWHEAIRDADDLPCAVEALPGFEAGLLARMESSPHLRALAGSPLLAAMLCALNLDRAKQLPRDRMGLYAAALELLLERRDVERNIQADKDVALERSQKLQILQDLAWRLSVTGRTELPKDAVIRWTGEKLAAMPNAPQDAAPVLDYLLERSGILREPVPGRIDFVHRTVQEYLTAKQFTDDGDLEPLIDQAHKDQWRETIIMAAGHANAPQRADLLSGLMARITREPRHARAFRLLIACCMETLAAIPTDLRDDVEACCLALVPPRDLNAARSLSNVGEPILSRLPKSVDNLSPAAARSSVRTAWMINGPDAVELLARYGKDPRRDVQEELIKGWEYFEPVLYAQQVLADAPLVNGSVNLPTSRLAHSARYLSHLRSLWTGSGVTDLSFLCDLPQQLEALSASGEIGDLDPVVVHANSLTGLYIYSDSPIRSTRALLRLSRLENLALTCDGLTDIEFVRNLPKLKDLTLGHLDHVKDLSPLLAQDSLTFLSLDTCPALTDLDALPALDAVTCLSLTHSSLTNNLRELPERAPAIRELYLYHSTSIYGLEPLIAINLRKLGLWGCTSVTDFAFIARLLSLEHLDLEGTSIDDLAPLSRLTSLETLWLRDCSNVTDLTPLSSLRKLRNLYIQGLASIDLAPLRSIPAVRIHIRRGQEVSSRAMVARKVIEEPS